MSFAIQIDGRNGTALYASTDDAARGFILDAIVGQNCTDDFVDGGDFAGESNAQLVREALIEAPAICVDTDTDEPWLSDHEWRALLLRTLREMRAEWLAEWNAKWED